MANLKKRRTSLVRNLLGHDPPPQKLVLRGMADLEKALAQRFKELNEKRARLARANAPVWDALRKVYGNDPALVATVRRQKPARRKSRRSQLSLPKTVQQQESVFLGSLGGTRVCPLDYQWWWEGGGAGHWLDVHASDGKMWVWVDTGGEEMSVSARTAVGIFFQSPSHCISKFSYWANPVLSFDWHTYCAFHSAHSDGFIGLFAASYDWAGNFTGTLVDQIISLWSDDSWWYGNSGSGSSRGFPLSANFQVDPDHWYALWVWCGCHASAGGDQTFSYSDADGEVAVQVPSISWQVG